MCCRGFFVHGSSQHLRDSVEAVSCRSRLEYARHPLAETCFQRDERQVSMQPGLLRLTRSCAQCVSPRESEEIMTLPASRNLGQPSNVRGENRVPPREHLCDNCRDPTSRL